MARRTEQKMEQLRALLLAFPAALQVVPQPGRQMAWRLGQRMGWRWRLLGKAAAGAAAGAAGGGVPLWKMHLQRCIV